MALDALSSILETVLHDCGINDISRVINRFEEALNDCSMRIEEWREAYYKERFPKRMTSTTMASQLQNFEIENLQLRNRAWAEGADRKFRLLASFEVGKKGENTVLLPKNRNAEIVLLNSTSDLKLDSYPSEAVDKIIEENHRLNQQLKQSKEQDTSNSTQILCEALETMSDRVKLIEKEKETMNKLLLECDKSNQKLKRQLEICEENTTDRLAAVNSHHKEEISIMRREIYRLQMENTSQREQIESLERELDDGNRIIRGLAHRAGLLVDETDSGCEADENSDASDDDHDEMDLEDMMDPGEDEQVPRGGENPRRQARALRMRDEIERLREEMEIIDLDFDHALNP